jgi:hypothetical protein
MSKAEAGRSHRSGFDMLSRRYSEILATIYTVTIILVLWDLGE